MSNRLLLEWYNKITKKHWNSDVVVSTAKNDVFSCFFDKSWKFLSEKSGWWKRKIYKNNVFFKKVTKNDRTKFFFGNGLIEKKKMKASYRIFYIPHVWKRHLFVISFFHQPDFSLRNFHNFRKKRKKIMFFYDCRHDVTYFSFFFCFSCIMSLGAISRVRVFIGKNDPFFNFCPFFTMSRWRRCNLTR